LYLLYYCDFAMLTEFYSPIGMSRLYKRQHSRVIAIRYNAIVINASKLNNNFDVCRHSQKSNTDKTRGDGYDVLYPYR